MELVALLLTDQSNGTGTGSTASMDEPGTAATFAFGTGYARIGSAPSCSRISASVKLHQIEAIFSALLNLFLTNLTR